MAEKNEASAKKNSAGKTVTAGKKTEKTQKDKQKKIVKIIAVIVALATVIAGAVVLALQIMPIDYAAEYTKAVAVEEAYEKMDSECEKLGDDLGDDDVSLNQYKSTAKTCYDLIIEADKAYSELTKSSAVKRDKDVKAKYEESKGYYDLIISDLKDLPDYYVDIHDFALSMSELYDIDEDDFETLTDSKVDEIVRPLTNSRFEELRNIAQAMGDGLKTFVSSAKSYLEASRQYMNDEISYSEYRDVLREYRSAQSDFTDLMSEIMQFDRYSNDDFSDNIKNFASSLGEVVELLNDLRMQ